MRFQVTDMNLLGMDLLTDRFGRKHDYLRISLTDACNFRCAYCMPDEAYDFMPKHALMQVDEIRRLAVLFVSLGVKKIRLTGGEPLARPDFREIIQALQSLGVELLLTTNGSLIHRYIDALKDAGVGGLTVSEVRGFGRQKGKTEVYRGAEYEVKLLPKVKVEIVASPETADKIAEAIATAARTGKIGDGKIWIVDLDAVSRIRTGEAGQAAVEG